MACFRAGDAGRSSVYQTASAGDRLALVIAFISTTTLAFATASGPSRARRAHAPVATPAPAKAALAVSYLYVVQGASASTAAAPGGGYDTTITVPRDSMIRFTDRPARDTAHEKVSDFIAQWKANGFLADPPNAALTGTSADKQYDVAVELTAPRWDAATHQLVFHVRPLVAGTQLPATFDDVSLFIDNTSQNTVQVDLTNLTSIPLSIQSVTPTRRCGRPRTATWRRRSATTSG